ncbi:hypothetical protein [Streptomyces sp.]|uniref:hypothetical protein n=1 Tax=Streptomyces sp. TaxID=1931 RepID=UPI002F949469
MPDPVNARVGHPLAEDSVFAEGEFSSVELLVVFVDEELAFLHELFTRQRR